MGTMKKIIQKTLILLAVLLAGMAVFSTRINQREAAQASQEREPGLPVVYMQVEGVSVNPMTGYRQVLSESAERESVTPLSSDRTLTVQIQPFGQTVSNVSYQVSMTDGSLLENGQLTRFSEENGIMTATFSLQSPIRLNQEFTLRFTLDTGGTPVYYYTRLVQSTGVSLTGYLNFVDTFYLTALEKNAAVDLVDYLESDDTAANRSFHDVNIHSSLDQVSWGSMKPKLVRRAVPVIREINATTATVEMNYVLRSEQSDEISIAAEGAAKNGVEASSVLDASAETKAVRNRTEFYSVRDSYRLRYKSGEVMLLNFTRSASQIFDASLPVLTGTGINLGVQDRKIEFLANEDGDMAAYVANGDLWLYDRSENQAVCVFSFRQADDRSVSAALLPDTRTYNTDHGISIKRLENNGDMTFVVYGYMASGSYEGSMGVLVCTYSAEEKIVEEKLFLPLSQSFAVLDRNISRLNYVDDSDHLYLFLSSEICRIDLADGSYTVVQAGISPDCFMASDTQETVAWMDGSDPLQTDSITFMNLRTNRKTRLDAGQGEKLRALGFVNEDLACGRERTGDILSDPLGNIVAGMYRIQIINMSGESRKDYQKEGLFITDVSWEEGSMKMILSEKTENGYQETGVDHIMNNSKSSTAVLLDSIVTNRAQEQMTLVFEQPGYTTGLEVTYAGIRQAETHSETVLEWPQSTEDRYFVYIEGRLKAILTDSSQAVKLADAQSGIVLDAAQRYIYERGNWPVALILDIGSIPEGVLTAPLDKASLQETLGDGYKVLNLTGCSQEAISYMIARGYPVLARSSPSGNVLVAGYDTENVWVYDPSRENRIRAIASDDSRDLFLANGNQFLSYMEV